MDALRDIVSVGIFLAVLYFIFRAQFTSLNSGLPKKGRGKKAKGGGDAAADWTEKIVLGVLRGAGRAARTILTAPFRRRP